MTIAVITFLYLSVSLIALASCILIFETQNLTVTSSITPIGDPSCNTILRPSTAGTSPCDDLLIDLNREYAHVGEVWWGENATLTREFPFVFTGSGCLLTIDATNRIHATIDHFDMLDLVPLLFAIFDQCIVGKGRMEPTTGGRARFHGDYSRATDLTAHLREWGRSTLEVD